MATWTDILTASLEPGAPARSADAIAMRDNIIYVRDDALSLHSALAGSTAEKVVDAALSTSATATGASWIGAREALLGVGAVGSHAFLVGAAGADFTAGSTYAGSGLQYSGVVTAGGIARGAVTSGTWLALGTVVAGASEDGVTLFKRVA